LSSLLQQIQKVRLLSLSKKGEGIHHIAFDVEDIVAEIAFAKGRFIVLNEIQKKALTTS
jgi:4-hydroxyphenylpyruvate dioxygenase-like putative hemolysin